jgi:LVIVD repeat
MIRRTGGLLQLLVTPSVVAAGLVASVLLPLPVHAALPHATCRSSDTPETGLSGETTLAEIDAGAPANGFKCNTDVVGQYQGEGASWQLTAWKNCAYFDQRHPGNPGSTDLTNPGVAVVDVSDPTNPTPTTWLNSPAMIDPWESVKVNPTRELIGGGQRPLNNSSPGDGFSVYDITGGCTQPVLKAAVELPGSFGHTGQWAPDGKTYYITPLLATPSIVAVDVTDPSNPAEIPGGLYTFVVPTELPNSTLHDLEFSKDGNTAYITMFGFGGGTNGFAVLDVSDFQQRRANPHYHVISTLTWDDGSFGAQNALPITIAGKPYVLVTDEAGAGFEGAAACLQGISANGFPRLIDISDPTQPFVAQKLMLDVADPANCVHMTTAPVVGTQTILADGGTVETAGPFFFGHSCHYCNVDDVDDAKIAACNCFASGLRFFDIHDINNPTEIAYFKPPAQGDKHLPGSWYAGFTSPATYVRQYDWATSKVSFPKDRGDTSGDIWTTSQDNGFMVISLFSKVTVTGPSTAIPIGTTTTFTATVTGAASMSGVTWSLQESSGATISSSGVFTASAAGGYHPVATSILDPSKSGVGSVIVTAGNTAASSSGCTAAPVGFGLVAAPLVLLFWAVRRRRR